MKILVAFQTANFSSNTTIFRKNWMKYFVELISIILKKDIFCSFFSLSLSLPISFIFMTT